MPKASKLDGAVDSLKGHGFRSANDFVAKFYGSPSHGSQSLKYKPKSEFFPEKVIDIMEKNLPSAEARQAFNKVIAKKAAEIMVKESTAAYRDPLLRLPADELTVPYLTTNFGLNTIRAFYANVLPCLSLLLMTLLKAPNDYEIWKQKEKKEKDIRAQRVCDGHITSRVNSLTQIPDRGCPDKYDDILS